MHTNSLNDTTIRHFRSTRVNLNLRDFHQDVERGHWTKTGETTLRSTLRWSAMREMRVRTAGPGGPAGPVSPSLPGRPWVGQGRRGGGEGREGGGELKIAKTAEAK